MIGTIWQFLMATVPLFNTLPMIEVVQLIGTLLAFLVFLGNNQPTSRPMPLSLMPPPPQFQFYEYEFVSERSTTSWVRQTHV
ncbi:hypothetical protein niasHT_017408 [Heterodera trifolii]|uniref:Uncharacterized protein n=1 Tax=Heterodera trifolii TaxID=157864 RepID=A0ABD2KWJ9_9BILA